MSTGVKEDGKMPEFLVELHFPVGGLCVSPHLGTLWDAPVGAGGSP